MLRFIRKWRENETTYCAKCEKMNFFFRYPWRCRFNSESEQKNTFKMRNVENYVLRFIIKKKN